MGIIMKLWKAAIPILLALCATGWAQQSSGGSTTVIRSEVRQVLVDTVVTDKKGAYASGMKVGDFKLLEDGKEQTITGVIRQADNGRGAPEYVVVLFDRMSFDDLRQARDAAKIVAKSVIGPRRFIAAATYEGYGNIRVDQAPSNNLSAVLQTIENLRTSGVVGGGSQDNQSWAGGSKNAAVGTRAGAAAAVQTGDVSAPGAPAGTQTTGSSMRNVASNNPGTTHNSEMDSSDADVTVRSLLTALTNLCKSLGTMPGRKTIVWMTNGVNLSRDEDRYVTLLTQTANKGNISFYPVQVGLDAAARQALRIIAKETGGFSAGGNNDLQGALDSIQRDQQEYYLLSYTPSKSEVDGCHKLTVKTSRDDLEVRSRKEYCSFRATDPLAGSSVDAELESIAKGAASGAVKAEMTAPFFYNEGGSAKLAVSSVVSGSALQFAKTGKTLHANVNVLGVAYRPDGGVAARFSDTIGFDAPDKAAAEKLKSEGRAYTALFELPAGAYNFDLVFSAGKDNFAKVESTVRIDEWDGKTLASSGIALCKHVKEVTPEMATVESVLSSNHARLISNNLEYTPSTNYSFKQTDILGVYFEIYDPELLGAEAHPLVYELKVIDLNPVINPQTNNIMIDAMLSAQRFLQPGTQTVSVGVPLKASKLPAGKYRMMVKPMTTDAEGHILATAPVRSINFEVTQ